MALDNLWNHADHARLSARIREMAPGAFILHGGPFVPRDSQQATHYLGANPAINALCHGEGEESALEALTRHLSGEEIVGCPGITGSNANGCFAYQESPPVDVEALTSPYVEGDFDDYLRRYETNVVTLETTRGCPFRCAFCDWGQTTGQRIRQLSLEKIFAELDWIGRNKVPIVELSDSNFGIKERDIEVAEHLCAVKER